MFTPSAPITIPPMVSVFTKGIGWVGEDVAAAAPVSVAAASPIVYFPILLPSSCVVKRVWWANGATVDGSCTYEVGVYSDSGSFSPGAKLISGSATQGTANQVQFVDVTDTSLPPGLYWIAISFSDTATTTVFSGDLVSANVVDARSRFQEVGTSLPATATPTEGASVRCYLCGFSTTSGTTDIPAPPSIWANPAPITIPPMVSVFTKGIGWVVEDVAVSSAVSGNGPNGVSYYPIIIPAPCVARRVWWANGATTTGGATIEVGVYSESGSFSPGSRLAYGSATQGTANQVQFVDVTDLGLAPGLYWIAITASTTTNTTVFQANVISAAFDAAPRLYEAGTSLPATATPAESTSTVIFLCGFSTTASP